MRRFLFALLLSGILAVAVASSGLAIPTDSRITIDSHARWVAPTTILVGVTYVCPETGLAGQVSVTVTQEETGAIGFGVTSVPCTGEPETAVVVVDGADFTPGQALASGGVFGSNFFSETDRRRIQIVI